MKTLLTIVTAFLSLPSLALAQDSMPSAWLDFSYTDGEHSRDSNAQSIAVSIVEDQASVHYSATGRPVPGEPRSMEMSLTLSEEQLAEIEQIVTEHGLAVDLDRDLAPVEVGSYFGGHLTLTRDGVTTRVALNGANASLTELGDDTVTQLQSGLQRLAQRFKAWALAEAD